MKLHLPGTRKIHRCRKTTGAYQGSCPNLIWTTLTPPYLKSPLAVGTDHQDIYPLLVRIINPINQMKLVSKQTLDNALVIVHKPKRSRESNYQNKKCLGGSIFSSFWFVKNF
ncbi:MAG: hypothetical protein IPP37_05625 [Saprospiraceae bacterium]|nr:hypothetical protein [Saprospiraceae bacterium]